MDWQYQDKDEVLGVKREEFEELQRKYPQTRDALDKAYESSLICAFGDVLGYLFDAGMVLGSGAGRGERVPLTLPYLWEIQNVMENKCSCVPLDKFLEFCYEWNDRNKAES